MTMGLWMVCLVYLTNGPIQFLTDHSLGSSLLSLLWIDISVHPMFGRNWVSHERNWAVKLARWWTTGSKSPRASFHKFLLIMAPSLIQQFIGNINNFNIASTSFLVVDLADLNIYQAGFNWPLGNGSTNWLLALRTITWHLLSVSWFSPSLQHSVS